MQTRWHSFIESLQNIAIGMGVALISQLLIFPMYDIHISMNTNLQIVAGFTAISILRSYLIRRWNNRKTIKHLEKQGYSVVPDKPTPAPIPNNRKLSDPVVEPDEHELVNVREG